MKNNKLLSRTLAALFTVCLLLSGCGAGSDAPPKEPDPQPVEPTVETGLPHMTASFGTQLTAEPCGQPRQPEDDGSRHISLTLVFFEDLGGVEMGETESRYDLSPAEPVAPGGEIPLLRSNDLMASLHIPQAVSGAADVSYLQELTKALRQPLPAESSPLSEKILFQIGDTEYAAYPNNTLVGPDGSGPCDFSRLCAMAWRYATPQADGGYRLNLTPYGGLDAQLDYEKREVLSVGIPRESYRLCLQGDGLHVDFGPLEAARFLFTELKLEDRQPALAPFDWTPPAGEAVSMTVHIQTEEAAYTQYNGAHTFWLYADGTLAYYPEKYMRGGILPHMTESIQPSWPRPYIVQNAFSWDTLCQVLREYEAK